MTAFMLGFTCLLSALICVEIERAAKAVKRHRYAKVASMAKILFIFLACFLFAFQFSKGDS